MSLDQELRTVLGDKAEAAEAPVPDIDALKIRGLVRRRRRRLAVALSAFGALVNLAVGVGWGQVRLDGDGSEPGPVGHPSALFVGRWTSSDLDGSHQTMTIRVRSGGRYEMVLRDDDSGPCRGPSTDTGGGRVVDGRLVVTGIVTDCENGRKPMGGGVSLAFVHRPATDTITDSVGVRWSRTSDVSEGDAARSTSGAFLGQWTSKDGDGSHQTMTIRPRSDEGLEMVLRDDDTGPCSGPSTDTGTGRLEGGELVITGIVTVCQDGGQPVGAGASLTFAHRAGSDTLRDDIGVVWSRE